jgi:hypothetical protein
MRHTHLCRLFVAGWLLCTGHGIGHAQPARTGDLSPEVKALLQELRGERAGSTGTSQLAPSSETTVEYSGGSATPDGYEQTLLRYVRLRELAMQTVVDHARELERQLHTLETQLAGATARSPQPQAGEETGDALSAEHVNERSPVGREPLVAETGDTLSSGPVAEGSAGPQLARLCRRRVEPFLQDYDRLTQHLEELAASSRAMAQRLRDLLR